MQMRYFQGLHDIANHYRDILTYMAEKEGSFNRGLIEDWGVNPSDYEAVKEEAEALRYLTSLATGFARGASVKRPEMAVLARLFNRHLVYLDTIHNCHKYNVNQHDNKFTRREYKTCTHYLFKLSLPAWVEKLPTGVISIDEKRNALINEKPLPIPFD